MRGCSRGACVVALGAGMRGCSGGNAWLLQGACMVARGGMRGCSQGGMHGCSGGVACMVALGAHAWLL